MPTPEPRLSIAEKLQLAGVVVRTFFGALLTAIRHVVSPPADSEGVKKSTILYILRSFAVSLSPRQRGAIHHHQFSTGEAIEQYCSKNSISRSVDELPLGAKIHWVGPRSKLSHDKVLLYFHGGGYKNPPIGPGHVAFCLRLAEAGSASLAMVEYTLTPTAHYPTQLHQAVAALKHILTITSPSQITFGGDSAGAHLSAGLLSHIMHPSKDIESLTLSEKLGGIAFICPFLSFNYQKESYVTCEGLDYLTLDMVKEFNEDFKPPGLSDEDAVKDPRLSPRDAPSGWWKNTPVDRILLLYGTIELFRDDNIEFGKRLEDECSPETKVDVVKCVNEVHVSCVLDQFLGFKEGDMAKSLLAWMRDSNAAR